MSLLGHSCVIKAGVVVLNLALPFLHGVPDAHIFLKVTQLGELYLDLRLYCLNDLYFYRPTKTDLCYVRDTYAHDGIVNKLNKTARQRQYLWQLKHLFNF